MFDNGVTRYPPGLNNARENGMFSDMYVPERIQRVHEYANDFDQFVVGDWTQQLNGGAIALAAGDGGLITLTSAASAITSQQKNPGAWTLAAGLRTWYMMRAAVDNVLGLLFLGLANNTATPFTAGNITDGVYMLTDNAGNVSVVVAVGGVKTTVATGVKVVGGQQFVFSAYWDGACYGAAPNGRVVYELTGTSAPVRGGIAAPANFPGATVLTQQMGVSASTAAARVLTVDALYTAKDRSNINATPAF